MCWSDRVKVVGCRRLARQGSERLSRACRPSCRGPAMRPGACGACNWHHKCHVKIVTMTAVNQVLESKQEIGCCCLTDLYLSCRRCSNGSTARAGATPVARLIHDLASFFPMFTQQIKIKPKMHQIKIRAKMLCSRQCTLQGHRHCRGNIEHHEEDAGLTCLAATRDGHTVLSRNA